MELPTSLAIVAVLLAVVLVVLIRRRVRHRKRKQRLSPVQFCENCGKRIHRQERTWYWHGAHVCLDCRKRLGEMSPS